VPLKVTFEGKLEGKRLAVSSRAFGGFFLRFRRKWW
jgi:hypothetical protein